MKTNDVGCITFAVGKDYQRMAYALALTLKHYGLPLTVVVPFSDLPGVPVELSTLANVVPMFGKFGKFEYEALAFDLSPYNITFKFDADMLLPASSYILSAIPLIDKFELVSGSAHTIAGVISESTVYRKIETDLDLPLVYSAFFGFKKSALSRAFFEQVRLLFKNWYSLKTFSSLLPATTDTLYSIAWKRVVGELRAPRLPFIHMKPGIQGPGITDKWTDTNSFSIDDFGYLKVNGCTVSLAFHYYDKSFLSDTVLRRLEHVRHY